MPSPTRTSAPTLSRRARNHALREHRGIHGAKTLLRCHRTPPECEQAAGGVERTPLDPAAATSPNDWGAAGGCATTRARSVGRGEREMRSALAGSLPCASAVGALLGVFRRIRLTGLFPMADDRTQKSSRAPGQDASAGPEHSPSSGRARLSRAQGHQGLSGWPRRPRARPRLRVEPRRVRLPGRSDGGGKTP